MATTPVSTAARLIAFDRELRKGGIAHELRADLLRDYARDDSLHGLVVDRAFLPETTTEETR